MKLKKNVNLIKFFKKVNLCEGEVFCLTSDHDCLNLKSTLTRFIVATFIESPDLLYSASIQCGEEDCMILQEFLE